MTTPAGHTLGHAQRRDGLYVAACDCGLDVWGLSLPFLWAAHDVHLATVKALSMRSHPSRRDRG